MSAMQAPDASEGDRSAAFFRAVQNLGFQLEANDQGHSGGTPRNTNPELGRGVSRCAIQLNAQHLKASSKR